MPTHIGGYEMKRTVNEIRYNWLLNNRLRPWLLSSKGIRGTDMADSMLARMKNGATWNDALFSVSKLRGLKDAVCEGSS